MCLIMVREDGKEIDERLMEDAYRGNSDGFGVMFPVGGGKVFVHKVVPESWADVKEVWDKYKWQQNIAMHFRLRTHGDVNKSQCHPYQVLSKGKHGRDVWLMHNGVMGSVAEVNKEKSDTWHFVEYMLRPMMIREPKLFEIKELREWVEKVVSGQRVVVLDGESGKFTLMGKSLGHERNGVWLSNSYSLSRGKSCEVEKFGSYGVWNKDTQKWNYPVHKATVASTTVAVQPKVEEKGWIWYKGKRYTGDEWRVEMDREKEIEKAWAEAEGRGQLVVAGGKEMDEVRTAELAKLGWQDIYELAKLNPGGLADWVAEMVA